MGSITDDYTLAEGLAEGNPINRIVFGILILFGSFILVHRVNILKRVLKSNPAIVIFFLFWFISISWTEMPGVSFKKYIRALGDLIMVLIVVTETKPGKAFLEILKITGIILIPLSIILYKYYPEIGRVYHRWSGELSIVGVTTNKNALGNLCLIVGMYYFWKIYSNFALTKNVSLSKESLFDYFTFTMISYLLFNANSATSTFCFFLGILIIIALKTNFCRSYNTQINSALVIMTILIFVINSIFNIFEVIFISLGRDITLTGRTLLWSNVLEYSINPIIGFGFSGFWIGSRLQELFAKYWWNPTQAHNGYLDIYLQGGWIGIILLIYIVISFFKNIRIQLSENNEGASLKYAYLLVSLFYNITESAFSHFHSMWFVFLLSGIYCLPENISNSTSKRIPRD